MAAYREAALATTDATQRIVKIRRDYNTWVANETVEDYALRFTPRHFRRWSELRVANTAFGAISFLVLEAIGGTIVINYGFINAFWAILAVGTIIFLTGLPICHYAAKYGLDMDLLTRGAGFGYIGSTITSFVYASFTFILFALEAAIMAYALEMSFHVPLYIGYLISALAVIPLVTHGITLVSRIQMYTQPLWLILLVLPFIFVLHEHPDLPAKLFDFAGRAEGGAQFNIHLFGAATAVGIALITQIGEQVDFLRFMPEKTQQNRFKWYAGVLAAGPGWAFLGMAKMLGGGLLAVLALQYAVPMERAVDPNQMYLVGFLHVFSSQDIAIAVTVLFVIVSQVKINITNAYAGSLAWSNFFARLTHSHPGRVVWMVFNALIAVLLMEMDVFQALEQVLGLYSNIAISWIAVVVADLVINKPLGLSPPGIEFKRAYLYDINPVGVGAMLIASALSITAFLGVFGAQLQAFSAFIALFTAFIAAPLIAWVTQGKYYIARPQAAVQGKQGTAKCCICEKTYEIDDMAHCPAYQGSICSLCCCLDARCHDMCKPDARLKTQWREVIHALLPNSAARTLETGLGHYLMLMAGIVVFLAGLLGLIYYHEVLAQGQHAAEVLPTVRMAFLKAFAALILVSGIAAWWFVLTSESRRVAQEESNRQTGLLMNEIESHKRTDAQLQKAKYVADQANNAKSRYITGISHELRTPLNSILGYAQILDDDESIPPHRRQAVRVIRKSGEHLLSLIEGTLDIARIESGKLALDAKPINFRDFVQQIVKMFEVQARIKGLDFSYEQVGDLPAVVRADKKRLGQILINILGNAVKFTDRGRISFRVKYAWEVASFEIEDSGAGILPEEMDRIFEPFARGSASGKASSGTGLGLPISKLLTQLMGGELELSSIPSVGSRFHVRLFLPRIQTPAPVQEAPVIARVGYVGVRCRVLVVDNERVDREMLVNVLEPLGFEVGQAESGAECLSLCPVFQPDLILMDLAMPGIDGWETIRLIREGKLSDAAIAIVSANAYDRGLDNFVGVRPEDFIVKPVNVSELLDWIGRRLELDWIMQAPQPEAAVMATTLPVPREEGLVYPPAEHMDALMALASTGFMRGIHAKLDELEAADARYANFVSAMRELCVGFKLEAVKELLKSGEYDADYAS